MYIPQWLFTTSIVYDAVLHFLIRAAFLASYWSFSSRSGFRFWIGMGLGADTMLFVFHSLVIVFRCEPTRASFSPEERVAARCMDAGFAVWAPAVMVCMLPSNAMGNWTDDDGYRTR